MTITPKEWRLRPKVRAAEIIGMTTDPETGTTTLTLNGSHLEEGSSVRVDKGSAWVAKQHPEIGDYYVVLEDSDAAVDPDSFLSDRRLSTTPEEGASLLLLDSVQSLAKVLRDRV